MLLLRSCVRQDAVLQEVVGWPSNSQRIGQHRRPGSEVELENWQESSGGLRNCHRDQARPYSWHPSNSCRLVVRPHSNVHIYFWQPSVSRLTNYIMKKRSEPPQTPFRGRRTAKTVSADHYLYLQTQFGVDRCTQFRVIVVTDPPTNTARSLQTNKQDRLQYTAPQLARSVTEWLLVISSKRPKRLILGSSNLVRTMILTHIVCSASCAGVDFRSKMSKIKVARLENVLSERTASSHFIVIQ